MALTQDLTLIPTGIFVLTENGELGTYDAQRQFRIDEALTKIFVQHNRAFLRAYVDSAQANEHRLAILYNAREPRPWGHFTFSLEDSLVRALYPSSGHAAGELTVFQQKSREKSVYRGMELLLDYRRDIEPNVPVYCPILYNSRATLSRRASALGHEPIDAESDVPTIDVLNLGATIPATHRTSPAYLALVDKLRQGVIRKDQRRGSQWSVDGTKSASPDSAPGESPGVPGSSAKSLNDGVALSRLDERRLHETACIKSIEQWLKVPHLPVSTERLGMFTQFRGLDSARLAELGERSLIYSAPSGTPLLELGLKDAWNMYLLEGSIMLTAADGVTIRIDGGTDKAAFPIASLKPRKYKIESMSPVSFLWVHDLLIEAVLSGKSGPTGLTLK